MLLTDIQRQAYDILSSARSLRRDGLSVHIVDDADAAAIYGSAIAAAGLAVGVLPPEASFRPDSDGPLSDDGGLTLRVNVTEPAGGAARAQGLPPVPDVACVVAVLLHSQCWPLRRDAHPLGLVSVRLLPNDEDLFAYQVTLSATAALDPADVAAAEQSGDAAPAIT